MKTAEWEDIIACKVDDVTYLGRLSTISKRIYLFADANPQNIPACPLRRKRLHKAKVALKIDVAMVIWFIVSVKKQSNRDFHDRQGAVCGDGCSVLLMALTHSIQMEGGQTLVRDRSLPMLCSYLSFLDRFWPIIVFSQLSHILIGRQISGIGPVRPKEWLELAVSSFHLSR